MDEARRLIQTLIPKAEKDLTDWFDAQPARFTLVWSMTREQDKCPLFEYSSDGNLTLRFAGRNVFQEYSEKGMWEDIIDHKELPFIIKASYDGGVVHYTHGMKIVRKR